MMKQHPRTPAATILLIGAFVGVLCLCVDSAQTNSHGRAGQAQSLEQLEIAIARTDADTPTWLRYADQLQQHKRFAEAALAYEKVLEREPYNREVRFRCGTVLALAGKDAEFFRYMKELVFSDAKLAEELFARPECRVWLSQPWFQSLQQEARSQAMD